MGDGGTGGENVGSPWGATSKGVSSLMRRDEREHWQPCEVRRASTGVATSKLVLEVLAASRNVTSPPCVDGGAAMMRGRRAGASTQLKPRKQFGWPAGQVEHVETTTQHPMAVAASHSTSLLTQCKRAMKPPTLYEF